MSSTARRVGRKDYKNFQPTSKKNDAASNFLPKKHGENIIPTTTRSSVSSILSLHKNSMHDKLLALATITFVFKLLRHTNKTKKMDQTRKKKCENSITQQRRKLLTRRAFSVFFVTSQPIRLRAPEYRNIKKRLTVVVVVVVILACGASSDHRKIEKTRKKKRDGGLRQIPHSNIAAAARAAECPIPSILTKTNKNKQLFRLPRLGHRSFVAST